MPANSPTGKAEAALKAEAAKHAAWSKKRKDAYVYGALRRMGWAPGGSIRASTVGK